MTWKEIDQFAADFTAKYPDYRTNEIAAKEIASHPDFSHVTIKQSWEANFCYFYADNTPTRVSLAVVFDKPMLEHLVKPLDLALNNKTVN